MRSEPRPVRTFANFVLNQDGSMTADDDAPVEADVCETVISAFGLGKGAAEAKVVMASTSKRLSGSMAVRVGSVGRSVGVGRVGDESMKQVKVRSKGGSKRLPDYLNKKRGRRPSIAARRDGKGAYLARDIDRGCAIKESQAEERRRVGVRDRRGGWPVTPRAAAARGRGGRSR